MKLTFLLFILLISIATIKGNYLRQRLDEEDQNKLDKNNTKNFYFQAYEIGL